MNIVITGGTGFIGKKLVASLVERGDTVRLLTRHSSTVTEKPSLKVIECNLVTIKANKLSAMLDGVDVLYHCAGQLTDPYGMRALHVDATRNLTEAASRQVAHWVQLSSVGVYGRVSEGVVSEMSGLNPTGQYEITKTESDQIVVDTANRGGFSYSILRPSNVFGAGMTNKSLFSMIAMIDRGLFSYIGKPGASANYIHVNNVVEGLVRCGTMHSAKGRIYNLSDHCTIEHFVEVIADALGCAPPWLRLPKPIAQLLERALGNIHGFPLTQSRVDALVNCSRYPISRIQQELGYSHVIAMEDGLRELVEVYRNPDSAS